MELNFYDTKAKMPKENTDVLMYVQYVERKENGGNTSYHWFTGSYQGKGKDGQNYWSVNLAPEDMDSYATGCLSENGDERFASEKVLKWAYLNYIDRIDRAV